MEGQSFDMAVYERELDESMAGVMPDSWLGHARLKLPNEKRPVVKKVRDALIERGHDRRQAELAAIKNALESVDE